MSDFENIFGSGANIESIISGINKYNRLEAKDKAENQDEHEFFSTYADAREWSRNNPGCKFEPFETGYISIKNVRKKIITLLAPIYKNNAKDGYFINQINSLKGNLNEENLNEIILHIYSISARKDIFITSAHLIGLEKSLELSKILYCNHGIHPISDNIFAIYENIDDFALRGFLKVDSLKIRIFSSPSNCEAFAKIIGFL